MKRQAMDRSSAGRINFRFDLWTSEGLSVDYRWRCGGGRGVIGGDDGEMVMEMVVEIVSARWRWYSMSRWWWF